MSAAVLYLGDEVGAAGYRLAGIGTITPAAGDEAAALDAAITVAQLVLISAAVAARIPEAVLRAAQTRLAPLTLVVPDVLTDAEMPDIAGRLRTQLGIEA